MNVKSLTIGSVIIMFAASAWAITWENEAGGVLTHGENWEGGSAPGPSDDSYWWRILNGPLTLTDGEPAFTNRIVTVDGNGLSYELDLGRGHEFYASLMVSVLFGPHITVSSGRFAAANFVAPNREGDGLDPVTITVSGADSELVCGDMQFGARGQSGNVMEICRGGRYCGPMSIGCQNAATSNNFLKVSDEGSVLDVTTLSLGCAAGQNLLTATNGALLRVASALNVGTYFWDNVTSTGNRLVVVDGARAQVPAPLRIGHKDGAHSNCVEIANGGVLDFSSGEISICDARNSGNSLIVDNGIVVASNSAADVRSVWVGTCGADALCEIRNGSVVALSNVAVTVGNTGEALGGTLRITGGSRVEAALDNSAFHYVGASGSGAKMELDNGRWLSPNGYLRSGMYASASNAMISARNGSRIEALGVIVGDHAEGCGVEVEDSEVNAKFVSFAQSHIEGVDPDLRHDVLRVSGSRSRVTAEWDVSFYRDTKVVFAIPAAGYETVPVEAPEVRFDERAAVSVVVEDKYDGPRRVVLMRSAVKMNLSGVTFETNRGRFDNTDTEIAVVLPRNRGLVITVK